MTQENTNNDEQQEEQHRSNVREKTISELLLEGRQEGLSNKFPIDKHNFTKARATRIAGR